MLTIKSYILLLLIIICLVLISCQNDVSESYDFMIRVDSIKVPQSVSSATPFVVEFYGTIGFNECLGFKTFKETIKNNDIIVEAWGSYNDKQGACPDGLVSLDGQKFNLTIPIPGIYRILVREPGDYSLVWQITVN